MLDFSVIIPTFNRHAALERLLGALVSLDYPAERFQVIVVNDGGAPIPPELLAPFWDALSLSVVNQPNLGSGAARNHGVQHARGEYLAFIDDDCVPARDWLCELRAALGPQVIVGGAVLNGCPENVYATASHLLMDFLYRYYHLPRATVSQEPFFTTNNMALARALFVSHGGFDRHMAKSEDRELCARLHACGATLHYAPQARVVHYRELTGRSFWSQHLAYGRGASEYHTRQRARQRDTLSPEPLEFYAGLLLSPWREFRGARASRLTFLLALAQSANLIGFLLASRRPPREDAQKTVDARTRVEPS